MKVISHEGSFQNPSCSQVQFLRRSPLSVSWVPLRACLNTLWLFFSFICYSLPFALPFFLFLFVWHTMSSPCFICQGWLWTSDPPAFTSQLLGFLVCSKHHAWLCSNFWKVSHFFRKVIHFAISNWKLMGCLKMPVFPPFSFSCVLHNSRREVWKLQYELLWAPYAPWVVWAALLSSSLVTVCL